MANHDNSYKRLFSHPEMVADLLRGFVREDWVRDLHFSTLERVSSTFVTPEMNRRESDVVWRVRWERDRWLYVYVLIELQSTVDPLMALRVLVYVGLLYQRLLQERQIPDFGKLPPVLPLVLYNGYAAWGSPREVSELIEAVPGGLELYRPRLRYCLLDERRIADSELESLRNLAVALFRLEKSRGPEDVRHVATALAEWLTAPEQLELRRSFSAWITKVLLPSRMPGVVIPEVEDLQEVRSMLADSAMDWTLQWKQEGLEEGRQEGLQEGLQEGRREGLREGQEAALARAREALLRSLAERFGPIPEEIRRRVEAIAAIEDLTAFTLRAGAASSLADL